MSAQWWPDGAPYPVMPCGQYTSRELRALLSYGSRAALEAVDAGNESRARLLAGWLAPLIAEDEERRAHLAARFPVGGVP